MIKTFSCRTKQSLDQNYIVYDLDTWPKHPLMNFTIRNCLFGATSLVKNNDKEKFVFSGFGIAFDGKVKWSFDNDTARNVVILKFIQNKKALMH